MTSKRKVLDRMVMALAGRVSEEIFFGDDAVGSGASDDFRKVTSWANTYVTTWGMSKRVGPVYYASQSDEVQKPFSEETAKIIVASPLYITNMAG
jgi:AFG3 family protein